MKRFKCILLVDDNEADNYIHTRIIKDSGVAEEIKVVESGEEALALIAGATTKKTRGNSVAGQGDERKVGFEAGPGPLLPDLVFLDINMPAMNGWEFLDELGSLEHPPKEMRIVMLSNSLNPEDEEKAGRHPLVLKYLSKPVTQDLLRQL